jgi:hypothetical protein
MYKFGCLFMGDTVVYLQRLETALQGGGKNLTEPLCEEFSSLPLQDQVAFARAMIFTGCKDIISPQLPEGIVTHQEQRILAARLMLLSLYAATDEPRWSSWLLDHMWEAVLETPDGQFSDLFQALSLLWKEIDHGLTQIRANFVLDITHHGRLEALPKYKEAYAAEHFDWMLHGELTTAQAYLFVYSAPRTFLTAQLGIAILRALVGTIFWKEAVPLVRDGLETAEGKQLIQAWLSDGVDLPYKTDLLNILAVT